jgi:hypothetical protein
MKALILNNKIIQIEKNEFPVSLPLYWVECPDETTTSWSYDGDETFTEPLIEPETPEQIIKRLESALDAHLDAVANSYRYESIRTMVTYALSTNPQFAAEGNAGLQFRDAVYSIGIEIIAEVQAGNREIPTESELIALMPKITDFL